MNGKDVISRLLEKFRFTAPLPGDVRREMPTRRKSGLVSILRMKRKYGLFIAPVIWFFFQARRMGFTISVAKSALIVWGLIIMLSSAVSTGMVFAVKQFTVTDAARQVMETPGQNPGAKEEKGIPLPVKEAVEPPASLGVVPFEFVGAGADLAGIVTRKIGGGLIGSSGAQKIVYVGGPGRARKAKRLLLGTVVKLGDGYRITARVVDTASSRILVFASEKISTADEVESACEKITVQVRGAVE